MKKNLKLPTILGVLILLFGVVAGIYLINSKQVFKISADVEAVPKNVRLTNITNNSLTVSWTTDVESNGFVKWGNSNLTINKVALEENSEKSFVHSANIIGSTENSDVFIKINSEGKDYDNNGVIWQSKTLSAKAKQTGSLNATGSILQSDGKSPGKALVYLSINGIFLSGITSNEGTFIIPISNYIENISDTTVIDLTVNAGPSGTSQAVIYSKAIKSIPSIIIGKTYDFRTIVVNESNDSPQSSLSIPESVEISSRFEIKKLESSPTTTSSVSLDSIKDGEIINTVDPEFFGKGPKSSDIEVMVESELQEAAIKTDSKGSWKWSPPNDLEPGNHTVTIKWRDASGVLRTLKRSFVVQASEGPAFESTPSATPLVLTTPSATSSASATPKVTKTPVATAPPTPETGDLIPTVGLFLIGIGILLSSVYVWNKAHAY